MSAPVRHHVRRQVRAVLGPSRVRLAGRFGVSTVSLTLHDETLEQIARRVAAILSEQASPAAENDCFLDVAGAAEFLACPTSRIYALVSAKRIPHHRDGSRLLFDRGELREYIQNGGARRP
jgi:excisionase family DNA binding protein